MVDMMSYEYPNNPDYYPGKGPFMLPEKWERDEKTIYYFIPRTLHEWWGTMLGESGTAILALTGFLAFSSKVITNISQPPLYNRLMIGMVGSLGSR